MALMERVATLLRANVNDMLDRAEDPEKLLKQLVLDMENQLLQVKTQVAIALADQHQLERKARDSEDAVDGWQRKAELAVSKGDDELARAALERALGQGKIVEAMRAQVADQAAEADALRTSYTRLEGKLAETRAQCDLLIAEHRRARLAGKGTAEHGPDAAGAPRAISRMKDKLLRAEAQNHAQAALASESSLEDRLERLETDDRVEQMLAELKARQQRLLPTA